MGVLRVRDFFLIAFAVVATSTQAHIECVAQSSSSKDAFSKCPLLGETGDSGQSDHLRQTDFTPDGLILSQSECKRRCVALSSWKPDDQESLPTGAPDIVASAKESVTFNQSLLRAIACPADSTCPLGQGMWLDIACTHACSTQDGNGMWREAGQTPHDTLKDLSLDYETIVIPQRYDRRLDYATTCNADNHIRGFTEQSVMIMEHSEDKLRERAAKAHLSFEQLVAEEHCFQAQSGHFPNSKVWFCESYNNYVLPYSNQTIKEVMSFKERYTYSNGVVSKQDAFQSGLPASLYVMAKSSVTTAKKIIEMPGGTKAHFNVTSQSLKTLQCVTTNENWKTCCKGLSVSDPNRHKEAIFSARAGGIKGVNDYDSPRDIGGGGEYNSFALKRATTGDPSHWKGHYPKLSWIQESTLLGPNRECDSPEEATMTFHNISTRDKCAKKCMWHSLYFSFGPSYDRIEGQQSDASSRGPGHCHDEKCTCTCFPRAMKTGCKQVFRADYDLYELHSLCNVDTTLANTEKSCANGHDTRTCDFWNAEKGPPVGCSSKKSSDLLMVCLTHTQTKGGNHTTTLMSSAKERCWRPMLDVLPQPFNKTSHIDWSISGATDSWVCNNKQSEKSCRTSLEEFWSDTNAIIT